MCDMAAQISLSVNIESSPSHASVLVLRSHLVVLDQAFAAIDMRIVEHQYSPYHMTEQSHMQTLVPK